METPLPTGYRHDQTSDREDLAHGTPCTACIGNCGLLDEALSYGLPRIPHQHQADYGGHLAR